MEKMGNKLTDRELIDAVLAWYEQDGSTEQLRNVICAYVQQNALVTTSVRNGASYSGHEIGTFQFEQTTPNDSENLAFKKMETNEGMPDQLFEQVDEVVDAGVWGIDIWALYFGIEDFIHRKSLGLLTMQRLAVSFCILISVMVANGAWHSSLSSERQKKATFKSLEVDRAVKNQEQITGPELNSSPAQKAASLPSEPIDEAPTSTMSASKEFNPVEVELSNALSLMDKAAWDDALVKLQILENDGRQDLQPMLTLLKVEALIQKRDTASMELARQLLMDCKCDEFDVIYNLLVARWMLIGSTVDRHRFLSEVASLPDSARERMATWARVRNGSKDAMVERTLETYASAGKSHMCDLLFLASFHYNVGKNAETVRELLDMQQQLRSLQTAGTNKLERWLLETAKLHLASKVDEILALIYRKPSQQIN